MIKRYILVVLVIFSVVVSSKEIVKIPEASGIDYCKDSDTLIVANDEGWYYEIRRDGKILSKNRVKKYDLEGVICKKKNFIFAVEDKGLLKVNRETKKSRLIKINPKYNSKKVKLLDKDTGIEGIAKSKEDLYYISKQSKKRESSFIAVVKIKNSRAKIVNIIKHKIVDIAGLTIHNGYLYMVSDKKNILLKYDIKKEKVLEKIKLSKMAQEGIAFDNKGFYYIADDNGRVMRYEISSIEY